MTMPAYSGRTLYRLCGIADQWRRAAEHARPALAAELKKGVEDYASTFYGADGRGAMAAAMNDLGIICPIAVRILVPLMPLPPANGARVGAAELVLSPSEIRALLEALRFLETREGMRYINCPRRASEAYAGPRAMVFPDPVWIRLGQLIERAVKDGAPALVLRGDERAVAKVVIECAIDDAAIRARAADVPKRAPRTWEAIVGFILPVAGAVAIAL